MNEGKVFCSSCNEAVNVVVKKNYYSIGRRLLCLPILVGLYVAMLVSVGLMIVVVGFFIAPLVFRQIIREMTILIKGYSNKYYICEQCSMNLSM